LFVAGGFGLLISVYLAITAKPGTWDRRHTTALAASILVYVAGLFLAFWIIQTKELWQRGLRDPQPTEQVTNSLP
jgi:hypothetical protein